MQGGGDAEGKNLEVGPFIVGGQQGMHFRGSLDLGDLDQWFVAHPLLGVVGVERLAGEGSQAEHRAVAAVGVVGDCQRVDAPFTQTVLPGPQFFRVLRIDSAEGELWSRAVSEHHVAVEVAALVGGGRVLVGDEGRECARVVVSFGRFDDVVPGGLPHRSCVDRLHFTGPHTYPGGIDRRRYSPTGPTRQQVDRKFSMKYIFVTGGVVSSLGKGLCAASLGTLLEHRGLKVVLQKFDPYLNVDPGTMSPFQHGECYVLDDGAETDLDLGHYERFTSGVLSRLNNDLLLMLNNPAT